MLDIIMMMSYTHFVKQLTIRNVSPELSRKLSDLSKGSNRSINATVLDLLSNSLGVSARRARIERYATWSEEEAAEFDEILKAQRPIDKDLWS